VNAQAPRQIIALVTKSPMNRMSVFAQGPSDIVLTSPRAGITGALMSRSMDEGLFHFVMIKLSRYDDDGYPLQWIRSAIPSNTLICVYALMHRR